MRVGKVLTSRRSGNGSSCHPQLPASETLCVRVSVPPGDSERMRPSPAVVLKAGADRFLHPLPGHLTLPDDLLKGTAS